MRLTVDFMQINGYSFKASPNQHLVVISPPEPQAKSEPPQPVDHVVVIDVSGSMTDELPLIREHLKIRVSMLVRANDTLTIVWFSGKGQCGRVLFGQTVANLQVLKSVHDAIDRFLQPVGMTGFVEPLKECEEVWAKLRIERPDAAASLLFMSDGCDNQWPREEILSTAERLLGKFQSATFVEYGLYADRKMLTTLAEKLGGEVIFAEDFPGFVPEVERAISNGVPTRLHTVELPAPPIDGLVIGVGKDQSIRVFRGDRSVSNVPVEGVALVYLSKEKVGEDKPLLDSFWNSEDLQGYCYALISALAHRMNGAAVKTMLREIGDIRFILDFETCFGKQRFSDFSDQARMAAFEPPLRMNSGCDPDMAFREDAPTVVDLFDTLTSVNAVLMLDHATFRYERIGRKAINSDPNALKFRVRASEGYPISALTLNEDRPNISVLVKKEGTVFLDVPDRPKRLPLEMESFIWRNYTIVKDAIVHVNYLPVKIPSEKFADFMKVYGKVAFPVIGISPDDEGGASVTFDLRKFALTNRVSIDSVTSDALFEAEYELCKARAAQKVFKHFAEAQPKNQQIGAAYEAMFGAEGAAWLRDHGVTEFGGFAPKKTLAEATDVYMGVELRSKLKGLSSLPKVEEAQKRIKEGGKLTPSMELMKPYILDCEGKPPAWANGMAEASKAMVRDALLKISKLKYAIVVGQTWFTDAAEPGKVVKTLTFDGRSYECTAELVDVEIEV